MLGLRVTLLGKMSSQHSAANMLTLLVATKNKGSKGKKH